VYFRLHSLLVISDPFLEIQSFGLERKKHE